MLDEFETPDELRDRPVSKLSGGWQRLMLIARIWVTQPDALLLDEPTNHLDLTKLFQLETWLNTVARGIPVVIASHDRDFLDATTNRTLFLRPGTSHYFAVPYSHARAELAKMDEAAEAQLERDLKDAKQLRKQAAKLTNIGINSGSDLLTVKAKQLKDRAAKIEEAARPVHKERSGEIRLANSGTHAKVLVAVENLTVTTPPGDPLFRIEKLHIFQGDRIVLLGRNGAGKSQFVKLLHRAIGRARRRCRASRSARRSSSATPTRRCRSFRPRAARATSSSASASATSGPRRCSPRPAFPSRSRPSRSPSSASASAPGSASSRCGSPSPTSTCMDEPTNHVDITGQERLESEILEHEATTILVSHDRSFVRAIGTRFLEIEGKRLMEVEGPEAFFREMAAGSSGVGVITGEAPVKSGVASADVTAALHGPPQRA